jgi:hypothetical protein
MLLTSQRQNSHGHIQGQSPAIDRVYWPHSLNYIRFKEEDMKAISVVHRPPKDFSDRFALALMRVLRWGVDFATGYKHDVEEPKKAHEEGAVTKTKPYGMSERKWLIRFIFLESVAGVPGMVAGMVRHLNSIRRLRRDNGWCVGA